VGVTFAAGLAVTYYFVRRTLPGLNLGQLLVVPLIATLAAIAAGLGISMYVDTLLMPLVTALLVKAVIPALLYLALVTALAPSAMRDRVSLVRQLFREPRP
jgi:hypothetical protein